MRKIHINNEVWKYRVGKGNVVIQEPEGLKCYIDCSKFHGNQTPDDFDRGKWKGTSDGMIKPSEVKKYIEENLI